MLHSTALLLEKTNKNRFHFHKSFGVCQVDIQMENIIFHMSYIYKKYGLSRIYSFFSKFSLLPIPPVFTCEYYNDETTLIHSFTVLMNFFFHKMWINRIHKGHLRWLHAFHLCSMFIHMNWRKFIRVFTQFLSENCSYSILYVRTLFAC